jgi:hypothetical protein
MTGRSARDRIAVPDVPVDAIHGRLRAVRSAARVQVAVCAALCLVVLGAAAGFGAGIVKGVQIWLSGDRGAIVIQSFVMVREPTIADVRDAVGRATFPVVLPTGLPAGTRVTRLFYAPNDHPNALVLQYSNDATKFDASFTLLDSRAIETAKTLSMAGTAQPRTFDVVRWNVGGETVVSGRLPRLSRDTLDRIEAAMADASPQRSVAATEPMLRKISVQDASPQLADIVERYAPHDLRVVLLGQLHPREIAKLVSSHEPMLDSHIVYLSSIPSTRQGPDYAKATLVWPKTIVISANGVRAIDALFRSIRVHGPCACAILFDGRDAATYHVWKIPLSAPATWVNYAVDARTLAVRRT